MQRQLAIVAAAAVLLATGVDGLLAPWYLKANVIQAALKGDKWVRTAAADSEDFTQLLVDITVLPCPPNPSSVKGKGNSCPGTLDKAQALATLLPCAFEQEPAVQTVFRVTFQGQAVPTQGCPQDPDAAMALMSKAVAGNDFFYRTHIVPGSRFMPSLNYLIFKPLGVQYYSDDLSEMNGYSTLIAEDAFDAVLGITQFGVFSTTAPVGQGYPGSLTIVQVQE